VEFIIQTMARMKRNGDKMQPCFTPMLTLKVSVSYVLQITWNLKVVVHHCNNLEKLNRDSIVPPDLP
jgi:hypothetical protein